MLANVNSHLPETADGQPSLRGSGRIIKPRVENAAVVSRLVLSDLLLLLENRHRPTGPVEKEFVRGRQSDDSTADDCYAHATQIRAVRRSRVVDLGARGQARRSFVLREPEASEHHSERKWNKARRPTGLR